MISYQNLSEPHISSLCELALAEGWDSFDDPDLVRHALNAPGCITVVALDGGRPIGFIQMQSDGRIHAHISNLLVAPAHRRRGVARALVEIAFSRSGAKYVDLASTEGSDDFYRSFRHQEFPGFRLYPDRPSE